MPLSNLQLIKSEINKLANEPVATYGFDYFKKLGPASVDMVIRRVAKIIMTDEHDNDLLNELQANLHGLKHREFDDKTVSIMVHTWQYLNNLERKHIIQKLDKTIDKTVKTKLLADVEHFLLKMRAEANKIERGATADYMTFVKGYSQLAAQGPVVNTEFVNKLYDIIPIDIRKSADNKLNKIVAIDSYAHMIHNSNCGAEAKEELDKIAETAKAMGEQNREDRLLVLYNPEAAEQLKNMTKMEILYKANLLENRLRARALNHGVESLSNEELCILWGYLSGELN